MLYPNEADRPIEEVLAEVRHGQWHPNPKDGE